MKQDRLPFNSQYVVTTFSKPVLWPRSDEETWLLNPLRRYMMHADHLSVLQDQVESISDVKGMPYHNPLRSGMGLASSRILIERNRDRGIGDLLFLTGPLSFLQHTSGNNVHIDVYALADRGQVLLHNPALKHGTTLHGPLHYDDLGLYNYQWLIDTVTEFNEEPDQLNVYDALYAQLGFLPQEIEPKFKRPSAYLVEEDYRNLDQFYRYIWNARKIDLRRAPYYVVAPFAAASIRSMNYGAWLEVIKEMASRRPVLVVGHANNRLPDLDISVGEFQQALNQTDNVFNVIGSIPLRVVMAAIAKAVACITLDSGLLYVAQAFRTPAISIWGSHDPGVRIGYDKDYMDLAIWNQSSCRMSPCYGYASFPAHKCPNGARQVTCDVLASVSPEQVVQKLDLVESNVIALGTFPAKKSA